MFFSLIFVTIFLNCCGTTLQFPSPKKFQCEYINDLSKKRIIHCLKEKKIVRLSKYDCHTLGSKGYCEQDGEKLFFDKNNPCGTGMCILFADKDGVPCREEEIAFQGECKLIKSTTACKEKGQILDYNLFGEVKCRCAERWGYIERDGNCYPQYFQGPCGDGRHLVKDDNNEEGRCEECQKCVNDTGQLND